VSGEKFVNEREPRDVESARFIKECLDGNGVPTPTGKMGIWLDSPMLDILHGEGRVRTAFVGKWKVYDRLGIDISRAPMLVYPTLHYQNGGLKDSAECETVVPGLYVAGEVTGGLHGENRLMGNSLMDIVVFGRIAGRNAALFASEKAKDGKLTLEHVRAYLKELREAGIKTDRVAPMLLPDYTTPEVKEKQLTLSRLGTLR
jgi:succinate dehydrogenase/fumarate reductase flavoprotein subunit